MFQEKMMFGKNVADFLTESIIEDVEKLKNEGFTPKLAMLKVGNKEEDASYQRGAINRCRKCGIENTVVELDENCTQAEYIEALQRLNEDITVSGILCFRPLPKQIDEDIVKYYINEKKDVDCFSPINLSKVFSGDKTGYSPCTPMGVVEILKYYGVELIGKSVVVIGRSLVVGKPLSMLLLSENATVTVCHSKTLNLKDVVSNADIVISCIGRFEMINKDYIKPGAVVVDVGINFDDNGKMSGDIDFEDVVKQASLITPVPGGVGAVTTTVLARNIVKACKVLNK